MKETTNRRDEILADIVTERAQQDLQWGGPEHDDQVNTVFDWFNYISRQVNMFWDQDLQTIENAHDRLNKIAALAVAARESLYRIGTVE